MTKGLFFSDMVRLFRKIQMLVIALEASEGEKGMSDGYGDAARVGERVAAVEGFAADVAECELHGI